MIDVSVTVIDQFKLSKKVYAHGPQNRVYNHQLDTHLRSEVYEQAREFLRAMAYITLKEEQHKGFTDKPIVRIDGKYFGGKEKDAKKRIEYFDPTGNVMDALNMFVSKFLHFSPIKSGEYRGALVLFINGKKKADGTSNVSKWISSNKNYPFKKGDTIIIVNSVPYSGALEAWGITWKKHHKAPKASNRPKGAFKSVVSSVRRKYKELFTVFRPMIMSDGYKGIKIPRAETYKTGKKKGYSYPYAAAIMKVGGPNE